MQRTGYLYPRWVAFLENAQNCSKIYFSVCLPLPTLWYPYRGSQTLQGTLGTFYSPFQVHSLGTPLSFSFYLFLMAWTLWAATRMSCPLASHWVWPMGDTSRTSKGRRRVSSRYLVWWLPFCPGDSGTVLTQSDRCSPNAVDSTGAHQNVSSTVATFHYPASCYTTNSCQWRWPVWSGASGFSLSSTLSSSTDHVQGM